MPGVAIYGAFLHLDTKINKYMCCQFQNDEKKYFWKIASFCKFSFYSSEATWMAWNWEVPSLEPAGSEVILNFWNGS